MADPFIAQIVMFGGNFAPRGWAFCDGQLLQISQYSALFSILGTTYGGDGQQSFGLPDLRGRVPMHPGTGPGLSPRQWGQKGGVENTNLTAANLPSGFPNIKVSTADSTSQIPTGVLSKAFAGGGAAVAVYGGTATGNYPGSQVGGGQATTNLQPYLAIHYIISLNGVFPSA